VRILAIAGADFAERTRRFAFLLTVAAALFAGYLFVPDPHAGYSAVIMNGHPGLYSSAFLGTAMAILCSTFISLVGFFLVRGSVERDRELEVDGLVCSSPVRKLTFIFGKWTSNLGVLCSICAIVYIAAIGMQLIRAQDRHVDLIAYIVPYVVITVPTMALVAAIAIVFDLIPFLRGVFGGVVYFIGVWNPLLIVPVELSHNMTVFPHFDALGTFILAWNLHAAAVAQFPHDRSMDVAIGGGRAVHPDQPYTFLGMQWTPSLLLVRAGWFAVALLVVAAVSPLFDRFRRDASGARRSRFFVDFGRLVPELPGLRLVRAEFVLLLNGANVWWLLGAVGLAIASGVAPLKGVETFVLPIAFLWPLERLSSLGSRERRWHVHDVLASTGGYVRRSVAAQCVAGTALGSLICSGFIVRALVAHEPASAIACIGVAAATAALALALGTWSGASRLFEALYLIVWYVGPINGVPQLNYAAAAVNAPLVVAAVCGGLFATGYGMSAFKRAIASSA